MDIHLYIASHSDPSTGIGGYAGVAVNAEDNQPVAMTYGNSVGTDRRRALLKAAVEGLWVCKAQRTATVTILTTDGHIVRNTLDWMNNHWKTVADENEDLLQEIIYLWGRHNVTWQFVRGNSKAAAVETMADQMVKLGLGDAFALKEG